MRAARAADLVAGGVRFEPRRWSRVDGELRDAVGAAAGGGRSTSAARLTELEADPGRLEQVEARLQAFAELERRFGAPLPRARRRGRRGARGAGRSGSAGGAAVRAAQECRAEAGAAEAERARQSCRRRARRPTGPFARSVEAELAELGMDGARLEVVLDRGRAGRARGRPRRAAAGGQPGLVRGRSRSVASGGELSRIALAMRVAARAPGGPGTLLLDEVDAGVGGRTARAVGERLRALSASAQVICITHLPQIASLADAPLSRSRSGPATHRTEVERLDGERWSRSSRGCSAAMTTPPSATPRPCAADAPARAPADQL